MSKIKKEKPTVTAADLIKATTHPGAGSSAAAPAVETTKTGTHPGAGVLRAPDAAASVVCDNLVKIYKIAELEVFALQGLDLVVNKGELLGIIGASGSGKSTLMNILGGLDRPSAGRIWVDGLDLLNLSDSALDHYRRTMVGFVWQQGGRNLIPYLNAIENIELPMTLAGLSGREKRRRAEELLDAVSLNDRRKHHLSELSGGEQQRVAIAVALANAPHLLLADEPTGELDSNTAQLIYKTFQDLNERYGLTILIVSHDPTIARQVHRVVAIRDGKLATETVRATRPAAAANGAGENGQGSGEKADGSAAEPGQAGAQAVDLEEILQELTVLDSAGRLQIPKDYLQRVNIKSRVTLEVTDEGILIRAAGDAGHAPSAEALGAALAASKSSRRGGYHRLLDRVMNVVSPNRKTEG